MTAYCLIHGSGQGPEGWKFIVQELERRNHPVLTPRFQLDRTDEGLVFHAQSIVETLDHSGLNAADAVCVAHSAGGMYLPLIAERWHPRRMVFLAALIPCPGMSVRERLQNDPSMFHPHWLKADPYDERVSLDYVYHDCPPDRLEWAMSTRIVFYAKRAIEERCPLHAWPAVPSSYIVCAEDRTL